jgi:enamine deaminase RidA (YjgF/YER057c/UK114 family)
MHKLLHRSLGVGGILAAGVCLGLLARAQDTAKPGEPPAAVSFYGSPQSPIWGGVSVPSDQAYLWTSGTGAPVLNKDAKPGSPERYGDTKTQAVATLKSIEEQLKAKGLSLKDVVYLRVYVVPDKNKENKPDYAGWFEAYAQFFGTSANPNKVARSTVGVQSLVNPDWLIEIEAVAVYPKRAGLPAK